MLVHEDLCEGLQGLLGQQPAESSASVCVYADSGYRAEVPEADAAPSHARHT